MAGLPIARQHPKGRDGTVFVTVEDETGDVQVILGPGSFTGAGESWGAMCSWSGARCPAGMGPPT